MRHQNAKSQLRNDTPCLAAYDARHLCDEERSELFERLCTPAADWAEGDRLPLGPCMRRSPTECPSAQARDRKSTRLNSSHGYISYAVFCLKKKTTQDP